jgi:hypothetical protein
MIVQHLCWLHEENLPKRLAGDSHKEGDTEDEF